MTMATVTAKERGAHRHCTKKEKDPNPRRNILTPSSLPSIAIGTAQATEMHRRLPQSSVKSSTNPATMKPRETGLVMSETEWQRLSGLADKTRPKPVPEREARQRARADLRLVSQEMVRTWDNTLEGARLKRLERLKIKAVKEEEKNKELDIEEAKFQAEKRKEAIAKAKEGLLFQTDRVKKFHQSLVLSEVLRERDAQVAFKKRKALVRQGMDEKYVKRMAADKKQAERDERDKAAKRMAASQATTEFQLQQVREKSEKRLTERRQVLREQRECDKAAEQYFAEEREKDLEVAWQKKKLKVVLDQTLEDKKAAIFHKGLEDDMEMAETILYADAKKDMMKIRRQKEKEILQRVQDRQDTMCKKLHDRVLKKQGDEDAEINRLQAEKYAARDKLAKEKQDAYQQRQREINEHRNKVMEAHEQHRKEVITEQMDLFRQERELDAAFHEQRAKEEEATRKQNENVQHELVGQVLELQGKQQAEEEADVERARQNVQRHLDEQAEFDQYTRTVIAEAKERKAPTHVLERAAESAACGGRGPELVARGGIKPSFMAMDSFGTELKNFGPARMMRGLKGKTAEAAKVKSSRPTRYEGDTKNRTGFIW